MKKIGLIGGITWLSTLDYYRHLNQMANQKLGGVASAEILMASLNFADIKQLTEAGDWAAIATLMCHTAKKLETAGAECLLIGANTMHHVADQVQAAIGIPLIHVAEETGKAIARQQLHIVALLGTRYTMLMDFYRDKLAQQNIRTIIPEAEDIDYINDAIYQEMGKGIFLPERRAGFVKIINKLIALGAQGVILGCTEIPILIQQSDVSIPVFDTTALHAAAAIEFAL